MVLAKTLLLISYNYILRFLLFNFSVIILSEILCATLTN